MIPRSHHRPRRTSAGLPAALCAALLLGAGLGAQEGAGGVKAALEENEGTVARWYEVSEILSKEREAWRVEKQLLQDLIEIRKAELEIVDGRIAEFQESTAKASTRRAELEQKKVLLEEATQALAEKVRGMELRTLELLERLPEPVLEKVVTTSQAVPGPDATDEQLAALTLDRRIINVLGTLQEIHRFQREVTVQPESRTLPGGKDGSADTARVTAIYLGIGQGFYVTDKGDRAARGMATEDGWVWVPANEYAAEIRKAIAIAKNEAPAEFVPLPVRVTR